MTVWVCEYLPNKKGLSQHIQNRIFAILLLRIGPPYNSTYLQMQNYCDFFLFFAGISKKKKKTPLSNIISFFLVPHNCPFKGFFFPNSTSMGSRVR